MKLYHYCANSAFISILKTRQLWFSELSLSNDPMEGRWIRKVFRDCCADREVASHRHERLLANLDLVIDMFSAAGFCMSEEGDLLSQWRAYAENGSGVSIAFNREYFEKLGPHRRDLPHPFNVALQKVEYSKSKQEEIVNEQLGLILEEVKDGLFDPPTLLTIAAQGASEPRKKSMASLGLRFLLYFPHLFEIKNPAFAEEREWRAMTYLIKPTIDEPRSLEALNFRAQMDRIVPYVAIDLEPLEAPSISEVVLGPRNITPIPVIERMLRALGWENVAVRRSTASYR